MAEKEAKVEETTTTPEPQVETTEPERTFTQEDLDAIVTEKDKAYQGLQKVIARKDQELETQRKQPTQSNTQLYKTMLEELEAQSSGTDELGQVRKPSPRIAQLRRQVRALEQQEVRQQHQSQLEGERNKMRKEAEDVGLDPDSEEFYPVVDAFHTGNTPEAKRRLDRILKKHEVKETKVGKTEEEIRAEERAKVIEELGLKKQDGGSPSGGGGSDDTFLKDYAEGKSSDHKRAKTVLEKIAKGG